MDTEPDAGDDYGGSASIHFNRDCFADPAGPAGHERHLDGAPVGRRTQGIRRRTRNADLVAAEVPAIVIIQAEAVLEFRRCAGRGGRCPRASLPPRPAQSRLHFGAENRTRSAVLRTGPSSLPLKKPRKDPWPKARVIRVPFFEPWLRFKAGPYS
jgi:hypothetical protein